MPDAAEQLSIRAFPNAVRPEQELHATAPVGSTIRDIVGPRAAETVTVCLDDCPIPRAYWHAVRPKLGTEVIVRNVPQGGGDGKNILRTVMMVAVSVAAPFAAGAMGLTAGTLGHAAATAALGMAGQLAVNALVPPHVPKGGNTGGAESPDTHSITGARNAANRYGVIARLYGTRTYHPTLAANYFRETQGNDQYLRMLVCLGYGPLKIGDTIVGPDGGTIGRTWDDHRQEYIEPDLPVGTLKIGETDLHEFDGVEYEIGTVDHISLFTRDVVETSPGAGLNLQSEDGSDGWYRDGVDAVRTTAPNADEIGIDLSFPRGLFTQGSGEENPNTGSDAARVEFRVEYRKVGATNWTPLDTGWQIRGSSHSLIRRSRRWRVPRGQYEVRVTRTRTYITDREGVSTDAQWSALRSFTHQLPWKDRKSVLMALRIKATDQLNGVVDELNVRAQAVVEAWTGDNLLDHEVTEQFHPYNGSDGAQTDSGKWVDEGWWSMPLTGPSGESNSEFRTSDQVDADAGNQYTQTVLVRSDGKITGLNLGFRTANGTTWKTATLREVDEGPNTHTYLARAQYTANSGDSYANAPLIGGVQVENGTYLAVKRPRYYNEGTLGWRQLATNNPAWAYADVLRGEQNPNPVPDSRINEAELDEWADWCDARAFEYNHVHDTDESIVERLRPIAAAGRASWAIQDSLFTVVRDKVEDPVQMLSPRNTSNFKAEKTFTNLPHAVKVQYDAPDGSGRVEVIAYDDDYGPDTATLFETLETQGVTDKGQAKKYGRYHLAQAKLRPETFTLDMDFENLACTRGSTVWLSHDAMLVGLKWGRVTDTTLDGNGNVQTLTLDEQCPFDPAKQYVVRVRQDDGTTVLKRVRTESGNVQTLTAATASDGKWAKSGDLVLFGELDKEALLAKVTRIEYHHDLTATLTLTNAAPEVLDADRGEIPDYDPILTRPVDPLELPPPVPHITNIRADESALVRDTDGSFRVGMVVAYAFGVQVGIPALEVEMRYRLWGEEDAPWFSAGPVSAAPGEIRADNVLQDMDYEVQLRTINGTKRSAWSESRTVYVEGKTSAPSDVTGFAASQNGVNTVFRWDQVPDADLDGYEIRFASQNSAFTWDTARHLTEATRGTQVTSALLAPGTWLVGIAAIDTSGNPSDNPTVINVEVVNRQNAIFEQEQATTWPGTKDGFAVSNGSLVLTNDRKGEATWDLYTGQKWSDL